MAWASVAGAAVGVIGSKMGSSGSQTTTNEPWKAAQPYLEQGMSEAQNIYNTQGATQPYTGPMQALIPDQLQQNAMGAIDYSLNNVPWIQNQMFGSLDPALSGGTRNVNAQNINPAAMGSAATVEGSGLSYQDQLMALLNNQITNPWIGQMANSLYDTQSQAFGDVSRGMYDQLDQNIKGLRDISNQSGSLGASRQALLSGEAMGRTNDALFREYGDMSTNTGNTLANMYGGIYEAGQNRAASLASQLQGENAAERMANAGYQQQTGLANAGWQQEANLANQRSGLEASLANANNSLQARQLQMAAGDKLANYSLYPMAMNAAALNANQPYLNQQQTAYDQAMAQYYEGANAPWDALQKYTSIVSPMGGMGSTQTQPLYSNPLSNAMGGAVAGQQLAPWFSSVFNSGGSSAPTGVATNVNSNISIPGMTNPYY